ncbi:MAG: MFS transporter [candidate division KSB1 bacterium]|nr:MFS transporter [candidate division KSB1 bacterium]MDZ7365613.1 MFS transporter [candidate division KSB1 bacterium]MDZ7403311.1 MFS transporter [candidate division KSB1 bacterium]
MQFSHLRLILLGFGFLGISLLWGIYNAYVPIFLQAGRPDFSASAGVTGFGLGTTLTGFIMTLDNLAALFILPYVGAWSDRLRTSWGRRKPFIAAGAPLAMISFIAIPHALGNHLGVFMAAIILMLLSMDLFRTPVIALMPDITPSPQRSQANGVINLMGGIGGILAAVAGGALFKISAAAPFYFGGVLMLLACAVVLIFIHEPQAEKLEPGEPELKLWDSLRLVIFDRDRSALRLLAAIFFWFLSFNALEVFFTSFAVNVLKIDSGEATSLLAFFALSIIVFSVPGGLMGARLGRKRTIQAGIAAFALLLTCGYFVHSAWQARILLSLAGVAWSLILVNSLPMVIDSAPQKRLGAYTGLYYLASQSSAIAGPVLAGKTIAIFHNDYRVAFLYGAIAVGIAFAFMWGVKKGEALTQNG